jgi:hypothetical protein
MQLVLKRRHDTQQNVTQQNDNHPNWLHCDTHHNDANQVVLSLAFF